MLEIMEQMYISKWWIRERIPESLERIFERFYRVDKSTVKADGRNGLRTVIANEIAKSHGSTIKAKPAKQRNYRYHISTRLIE